MIKNRVSREDEKDMKKMAISHPQNSGDAPKIIIGDEIEFKNVDIFSPTGNLFPFIVTRYQ